MKNIFVVLMSLLLATISNAQNCPTIKVEPYINAITEGDTIFFTCDIKFLESNVTYKWTISSGEIVSGAGTARIYVSSKGVSENKITATVEITGLPTGCPSKASASIDITSAAQLIVKGSFTSGAELKKAVQRFIAAADFKNAEDGDIAFIYLYKSSKTKQDDFDTYKQAIVDAFAYNKILPNQYKIVEGGNKKLNFYEMYLITSGGSEPKPTE